MKKSLLAALALTMTLGMGNAVAQQLTYPTKNIDVVIPKNPGEVLILLHGLSLNLLKM
ncbi:Uncharacterised protein [Proteus mirabilis]|nr:Uncharacterised protein [Proteus mirabilis]